MKVPPIPWGWRIVKHGTTQGNDWHSMVNGWGLAPAGNWVGEYVCIIRQSVDSVDPDPNNSIAMEEAQWALPEGERRARRTPRQVLLDAEAQNTALEQRVIKLEKLVVQQSAQIQLQLGHITKLLEVALEKKPRMPEDELEAIKKQIREYQSYGWMTAGIPSTTVLKLIEALEED